MIKLRAADFQLKNGNSIRNFTIDIYVTNDGEFCLNLPEEMIDLLQLMGENLCPNPKTKKLGYFSDKNLESLLLKINVLTERISRAKFKDEEIVLKYRITSSMLYNFSFDDRTLKPSGSSMTGESTITICGSEYDSSKIEKGADPYFFGMFVWPYKKELYVNYEGEEFIYYEPLTRESKENNSEQLDYLLSIEAITLCPLFNTYSEMQQNTEVSKLKEVKYSKEVAEVFIRMYKTLFSLDKIFKEFNPNEIAKRMKNASET